MLPKRCVSYFQVTYKYVKIAMNLKTVKIFFFNIFLKTLEPNIIETW